MKEFKGTKGEWLENKYAKGNIQSQNGRGIASCMGYSSNSDEGAHVIENLANAKLIIAAPDLLDACQELLELLRFHGYTHATEISKAKQAINKALK